MDNLDDTREATKLSEEEKSSFKGITIEEVPVDGRVNGDEEFIINEGMEKNKIKFFSWSSTSLMTKLIIVALVIIFIFVAVTILIFFGGIFLVGFAIIAIIGAIASLLSKL